MTKMMDQRIFVFVFLLCLVADSNSQGPPCNDPNQQLMNMVVYEGNSSSFFNQFDPNNVMWQIAPSHDPNPEPAPPYTIADDGLTPYPDVYTVTPTQLSIPKASIYNQSSDPYSTSGLYTVTYKTDGCQAMANLIVVSRGPVCLCTLTDQDNAELSCELEYGVTRILPNYVTMNWTTDYGDTVASETTLSNQDSQYYDISTSTYQITSSGAASYTCEVTFTPPDSSWLPNMATNAPTFNASCTVANCVKTTATTTIGPANTTNTPSSNSQFGDPCTDPNRQLMNTVVYEGSSSSFNQVPTAGMTWKIAPSYDPNASPTPPYLIIDHGSNFYPDIYVDNPTQLDIPKASIYAQGATDPYSSSGLYVANYDDDGCESMANLIVVSKGPDCQCTKVDQDNAQLMCGVEMGVTRRAPNNATMTWTTDSGNEVYYEEPTPNQGQRNYDISVSTYRVTSSGAASYTCEVKFKAPDPVFPSMATNAPTFTASCNVANCLNRTATTIEPESTTTTPSCPQNLVNIVVYEGSVAAFENLDDGQPVKWHFSSSSDPQNNLLDITDYDNKVNPMFVGAYNVTRTKLSIISATVAPKGNNRYSTAGVYFLTYQSTGCQTAANLIVIQRGPVCDRNENDPNNVRLSCNISYAESERQPSYPMMTWTTGSVVIETDQPTPQKYPYVYESLSQIPPYTTAPSYYQCEVTFNPPAPVVHPIPFLAQNSPSYTGSCIVASGTFQPITEIPTTTAVTVLPTTTTGIATTTGACVDSPACSSKWSDRKAFCPYVQQFRDDCPAFCNECV